LLEVLAGLGGLAPISAYVLIPLQFAASLVETLDLEQLEEGWQTYPPGPKTQALGEKWLRDGSSPVLQVPSAIVPAESSFVLNPRHAGFKEIRVGEAQDLPLDPRFLR